MGQVVIQIPNEQIEALWPLLKVSIEAALQHAHGELEGEDLLRMAKCGQAQVWTVQDEQSRLLLGTAVTQVVDYPKLRAVRVITLGGRNLDLWARELNDALEAFAKRERAQRLEAFGRKGLQRMLEVLAFRPAYVALVKEVEA